MSEMIELWTLQDPRVLEGLARKGYLKGNGRCVDRHYLAAYHWMMRQMAERIPGYPASAFPVWAWTQKPDMRHYMYSRRATPLVRIGLRIERARVFLHDYMAWHCILNNTALSVNEKEFDESTCWTREQIERTWERVFDLEFLRAHTSEWLGEVIEQATFERVSREEIFSIETFQPRKRR